MVSLKTVHCPRCGAEVRLDAQKERATCAYCGTTSYVESAHKVDAPVVVIKPHVTVYVSLGLALLAVAVTGATVIVPMVTRAPPAAPPAAPLFSPAPTPALAVEPPVPEEPVEASVLRVQSYAEARLLDTDGDKTNELLVPVEQVLAGKTTRHFAIYELASGKLLRQTPALEDPAEALIAVAHNRLVLAQPLGQVLGYDLASGDPQWSTALGERVAALCEADSKVADALQVVTDDGRSLLLDVKTGRQSPTKTTCRYPLAVSNGRHAPSDRRDYRAPRQLDAYQCGGVRVMGSDNYSVPDACKARAKVDSDRLDGVVAHALWRTGAGWLVLGVRKPGAYVPMVGVYERAHWKWKSEAPAQNPLEAEQGGPRTPSLHGDSLVVSYGSGRPERQWLTRFDVRDGTRAWSVQLPESAQSLVAVAQDGSSVVVHANDAVRLLSIADGSLLRTIAAH